MTIILLKESWPGQGRTLSLQLARRHLIGAALLLICLFFATAHLAATQLPSLSSTDASTQQLRQRLAEQTAELEALQQQSAAQSQAVGRQLAAMQARLLRMEALGARVAGAAGLEDGEFSFDEPAPLGGPAGRAAGVLDWAELEAAVLGLAGQINRRAGELAVLESLLRDHQFHQRSTVAGLPVARGWMSSAFGRRMDPFSGKMAQHRGVDFAGRAGSDVIAVASGVVTFAGRRGAYGLLVEISHGDGYLTRYAHQKSNTVASGDFVEKGQVIGALGSSGRATGPHVHFEVLKDGRHVDPKAYIARR